MSKIYPFKFLDSYSKDDTGLFFGRDEEIDALYQMIFQSNILMVYGASGTGKTSLIQCGLASRFQPHDWLALYIRRGNNLNDSFDKAIADEGGMAGSADLEKSFKAIYRNSFRPVYLIFDQFEELFILGTKDEQTKFIQTVKAILNVEQPVKMIFSIREEYVGHLYEFEKEVPQLMRKKLRVEPMNLDKVRQVIKGATGFEGSNITLKAGEEEVITESIFEKVRGIDRSGTIQLPYLQVFLDKLYMATPPQDGARKARISDAVFSMDTINNMGDIGDILRDFLEEQVKDTSGKLSTEAKPVTADDIWKILSPFATLEGTKEPISMQSLQDRFTGSIDTNLVTDTVSAFVKSRILRHTEEGDIYELAHDTLASKIAEKRTDDDKALLEVKRLIKSQADLNKGAQELLTEKQLNFISPYLFKLSLTTDEKILIIKSKKRKQKRKIYRFLSVASVFVGPLFLATTIFECNAVHNAQYELGNAASRINMLVDSNKTLNPTPVGQRLNIPDNK